ncbi:MAG: elongation factor G [Spirochaetes bacterium]|jgi:elongation factor G|nr:elongation factor G [Spirochaetota bacterium]
MVKEYKTEQIRNVAIIGHGGTGKSTLFDAMLFVGGKIDKIGSPDSGTLTSDFDEEEKERKISIRSSLGFVEIDDVKINILDTPGTADFIGETRAAVQASEAVILVVDSVDGVQIETEKAWRYLTEHNIPRIIFVNKMDKERAGFSKIIESLQAGLKANTASVCLPMGEGDKISGVIDTMDMKLATPKGNGKEVTLADIPADMKEAADSERTRIEELAAEGDDALIEKFLEGEKLTEEEMKKGLRAQIEKAKVHPVVCGSSSRLIGIKNLLNLIKNYCPSPAMKKEYRGTNPNDKKEISVKASSGEPFSAVVWKTYIDQFAGRSNYLKITSGCLGPDTEVLNSSENAKERITKLYTMIGNKQEEVPRLNCGDIGVVVKLDRTCTGETLCDSKNPVLLPVINFPQPVFSYAISAVNKADEDKVGQYFSRITDENPTITYSFNSETRESVLSGMGELQLGVILKTLKEKNKIDVNTKVPRVAYRETITKKAEAQYKHKKQSGGHGQYGEVFLRVAPLARGGGYEFKDSIVGGVVPKQYIPGVQKGVVEGMEEGVLAKFPVVDLWVELYYGSYHDVDSSEMSFKIAARSALKKGMETAGPQLLEPIMEVSIYVEKDFVGDILNDITSRRGRVLGMDNTEGGGSNITVVKANVPLAEMLRYTIDLRAMTSGKATFEMKFSHYDPISGKEAEKVISERNKQLEEEANK